MKKTKTHPKAKSKKVAKTQEKSADVQAAAVEGGSPAAPTITPEVVPPFSLETSLDWADERLDHLSRTWDSTDRQVYGAVGDFATAAFTTAHTLAQVALDDPIASPSLTPLPAMDPQLCDRLEQQRHRLRAEADTLLGTAADPDSIARVLSLEQLLDRIEARLLQLPTVTSPNPIYPEPGPQPDYGSMTLKQLQKLAKAAKIPSFSRLKKQELVHCLSSM
ncbi:Rho termination factor N-terminal domain-containing protein [Prochlorothrix hollandica]|uniref:Rho termination factor-like N-terminal domain-containing protein n=1 Tax=Prochlorothrix hollandica PCC 9006 = CALU 1027 TaxID=317619 RepID=A0A0M2Q0W9_PROHO|nr:Rho termination factor N-terminal domain-containing protein [Prochlorothrix hollandica]KKJ00953.1 hypothetical protein PROH_00470 [Prochlorothrix hollandica PCC 9006 = CALU 1027]